MKLFLELLQVAIGTRDNLSRVPTESEWTTIYEKAEQQTVVGVMLDGIVKLPKEQLPPKKLLLQWIGVTEIIYQQNEKQKKVIAKLAEIWVKEKIMMMVFKGQANGTFYPIPEHRATGDIDCWLFGEAEKGDSIMTEYGAVVDFNWYRHSKISFKGEIIENHRVMSHTRGNRKKKDMEQELRIMAQGSVCKVIDGCGMALMPSAQFNACFLTYHGLHHFLSEGLRMKQVLDWAMFLKADQENVDWEAYWKFCKKYKLERFAKVMTQIATEYLGVEVLVNGYGLTVKDCSAEIEVLAEKVLRSTLYDNDYLFNSGKNEWKVRWLLVKNMFTRDRWKYRDIAQQSVWKHLWESVTGFISKNDD